VITIETGAVLVGDLPGELRGPVFEPLADPGFFAQVRGSVRSLTRL